MTESEQKPDLEARLEAEELAKHLWDELVELIATDCVEAVVVGRIAQAFAEVIAQRNGAFFHIGEVWMERNRAVRDMLELEKKITEQRRFLFAAGKHHGETIVDAHKWKGRFDDLRVALEVALVEPKRNWVEFIERLLINTNNAWQQDEGDG